MQEFLLFSREQPEGIQKEVLSADPHDTWSWLDDFMAADFQGGVGGSTADFQGIEQSEKRACISKENNDSKRSRFPLTVLQNR